MSSPLFGGSYEQIQPRAVTLIAMCKAALGEDNETLTEDIKYLVAFKMLDCFAKDCVEPLQASGSDVGSAWSSHVASWYPTALTLLRLNSCSELELLRDADLKCSEESLRKIALIVGSEFLVTPTD